jgi:hypothetical protein
MIRGELRPVKPETRILTGLTLRARNGLKNGIRGWGDPPLTDAAVRDWVRETGARALRDLPNIGPKTQAEICAAFGFDPNKSRDEPTAPYSHTLFVLGADTVEEAIKIVDRSRHCQAMPRDRDVLIRHLSGETLREAGAAHGISASRVSALVKRASEEIYRERAAERESRATLYRLSWRAKNALDALGLRQDAHVTVHLRLFGDTQLLKLDGVGPGAVREIFNAFGFDPETDQHPFLPERAAKTMWSEAELAAARHASGRPAREMRRSALCGCFSCVTLFPSEWLFGEYEQAWCPCCGSQTVLPGSQVPDISNIPFLRAMRARWT